MIAAEKAKFSVTMMCRLLNVSRSGFYDWLGRPVPARSGRRSELAAAIHAVFVASGRTYGYRRVSEALVRSGIRVDDDLVRRVMRAEGLVPVQVKRRYRLTVADQAANPVPDLVGRDFTSTVPGAKLVGDITRLDTGQGPLFLATVIDCFSKAVIGWSIAESHPASLVCAALDTAAQRLPIPVDAVFHSDRGSEYTSRDFEQTLAKHGIRQSVGRTGICYDNAMAESFFGKLKTELAHHRTWATRSAARHEVIAFIEGFYNPVRLHS
ncbi:IS3 family transposase, partial [Kibdelosporangium lantanae]